MASTPSGTNGGCCENNIVVVVILPKLGTGRSNNLDHSRVNSLCHFNLGIQGPGPGVRRGSGVAEDQRGGPVLAGLAPVALGVQPVQVDAGPPPAASPLPGRSATRVPEPGAPVSHPSAISCV
jgi:hypothetical protein